MVPRLQYFILKGCSVLKLISKNTIFENQYIFFKIEWMDQLFVDYYINKILSKKQLCFLEIHALIIEIKTIPGRKLQNGEVFCALKGIWNLKELNWGHYLIKMLMFYSPATYWFSGSTKMIKMNLWSKADKIGSRVELLFVSYSLRKIFCS